jgi:SAM-dependent methyltransferase
MSSQVTGAEVALPARYTDEALGVLDADERARFLDSAGRPRHPEELPWELLYRIEPGLYARLVAGERLHEGILEWLPARCGRVLEIGAGTGRLTLELAGRSQRVMAVEPAAGLRGILEARLQHSGVTNVTVVRGFFDSLPPAEAAYDMVVSCSAFAVDALDHPDACLAAMESRCALGGLLVVIWPGDVSWLRARGFEHVVFEGPMLVEYRSVDEAVALARIFYPDAVDAVTERQSRFLDFTTLEMTPPRDLCWKRRA